MAEERVRSNKDVEIGSARPDEMDAVLEVMCEAFELPFAAARPVYYSDPYFDPDNKRVLRVNGRIVSCLTVTPSQHWIGRSVVEIVGIAGVATRLDSRRQGYAASLLQATVQTLAERGFALAGLFPYDADYYRRLGWETASAAFRHTVAPADLPRYEEAANVRPAQAEDLLGVASLYAAHSKYKTLHGLRDAKRWRYLAERVPNRQVYAARNGDVEGYLLAEIRPGTIQVGTGDFQTLPALRLMEFYAATESARRGLTGYLAAQTQVGQIEQECATTDWSASGVGTAICPPNAGGAAPNVTPAPGVMLRILDFPRLLAALKPNWSDFNGEAALTLRDTRYTNHASTVVIAGGSQEELPSSVSASLPFAASSHALEGDLRAWTQLLAGHISGSDACARGLLRVGNSLVARIAGELFPHRAPFLPPADNF